MTRLVVIAGPTAVGKGTLVTALTARHPEIWVSVSATTRPARPGEVNGEHYLFVSEQDFDRMIASQDLLEWATVHGQHRYGTPRGPVEEHLDADVPSVLEIDVQGARQVRETMPDAVLVFIAPPSWEELVNRLEGRGTETAADRARRLDTAREEMLAEAEFDHVVVNDVIEVAVDELERILGLRR